MSVTAGPGWTLHPHTEVRYRHGGEDPMRMGGDPPGGPRHSHMSECEKSSAYSILYGLFCLFLVILFLWLLWALFRWFFGGGYGYGNCCFSYGGANCRRCGCNPCTCSTHHSGSDTE